LLLKLSLNNMPLINTRGAASVKGFGFSTGVTKYNPNAWFAPTPGGVYKSTDNGVNWTITPLTGNIYGLAWSQPLNILVAATSDTPYWSIDGVHWNTASFPSGFTGCNSIVYGNGIFVAVSQTGGPIAYSSTGKTWTAAASVPNSTAGFKNVAFGNNVFCAVGYIFTTVYTPVIWTSTDGSTWTNRPISTSLIIGWSVGWSQNLNGFVVSIANGLAASGGMQLWQSNAAGTSWSNVYSNSTAFANTFGIASNSSITCCNFFIYGTSTNDVYILRNSGSGWSLNFLYSGSNSEESFGMGYGNGVFVSMQLSRAPYTSSNGTSWSLASTVIGTNTLNPPIYAS